MYVQCHARCHFCTVSCNILHTQNTSKQTRMPQSACWAAWQTIIDVVRHITPCYTKHHCMRSANMKSTSKLEQVGQHNKQDYTNHTESRFCKLHTALYAWTLLDQACSINIHSLASVQGLLQCFMPAPHCLTDLQTGHCHRATS